MSFDSEGQMVHEMIGLIDQGAGPWSPERVSVEFDYSNGRTDVIALLEHRTVLAIEAKLLRWRDALQQAYRNTCFAHQSFVVLPWETAKRASQYSIEFERRKVGLCAVGKKRFEILIHSGRVDPLLPSLTMRALACLEQGEGV